jgi:hypothetical protein
MVSKDWTRTVFFGLIGSSLNKKTYKKKLIGTGLIWLFRIG